MMQRLAEPVRDTTEHLTLGERLRQLRKATGCTTGEIAAAAGLTDGVVRWFEDDEAGPMKVLEALAGVYGVSVDDLTPAATTPAGPRLGEGRCEG